MRVAVIAIGDNSEARLIRDLLEVQGHEVRLALAGKPSDVFEGFSFFDQPADAAILAAHGDEDGLIFPELAPGVDDLVLPNDRLTPEIFTEHLAKAPPLIVTTACGSGKSEFAAAFLNAGATHYVAPVDYPEGADIAIWVAVFFRSLSSSAPDEAVVRANGAVAPDSAFGVFSP